MLSLLSLKLKLFTSICELSILRHHWLLDLIPIPQYLVFQINNDEVLHQVRLHQLLKQRVLRESNMVVKILILLLILLE